MIDYQSFCQLRQAWDEKHLTMAQIARALHLHPQTVKKWVQRPRYEQRRAPRRPSKLDEHKPAITRWLAQHPFTATQIWQRLREQGYTGGCSIVRAYVRTVRPPRHPAYLTLTYAPASARKSTGARAARFRLAARGGRSASLSSSCATAAGFTSSLRSARARNGSSAASAGPSRRSAACRPK